MNGIDDDHLNYICYIKFARNVYQLREEIKRERRKIGAFNFKGQVNKR